jgi:hypothetical protein
VNIIEHETYSPVLAQQYVLYNGLITTPVLIDFERHRAVAFVLGNPHDQRKWDSRGKNLTLPPEWDIKEPYIQNLYPSTLKPGQRYYYVTGGMTEPLSYHEGTNTFCMFDVGYRWDQYGKNLDYHEGLYVGADLVVQLPLCLAVSNGSTQSL